MAAASLERRLDQRWIRPHFLEWIYELGDAFFKTYSEIGTETRLDQTKSADVYYLILFY